VKTTVYLAFIVLLLASVADAAVYPVDSLKAGDRLRATRKNLLLAGEQEDKRGSEQLIRIQGTLVKLKTDSLSLQEVSLLYSSIDTKKAIRELDEYAMTITAVEKLEVYRGTKTKAYRGAVTGFLVTAGSMAVVFTLGCEVAANCSNLPGIPVFLAVGAVGGGIGAMIGSNQREEIWQEVDLKSLQNSR
jgi:hypothetical protein